VEIKNLPKGAAAIFFEKFYAVNPKLKYWNLLHYAKKSDFGVFLKIFISYFFILDIFKNVHFQKVGRLSFWDFEE